MAYKVIQITVIMNMLDWTSSSRQGPVQQAHISENRRRPVRAGQEGSRERASCNSHPAMPTALGLHGATFGQHDKSTQAPSSRSDLQEPLSVPVPRWLLHAPPSLQSLWSSGSDSTMSNINWCTQPVRVPCSSLSGAGGIIPTDQGMPPWRYSPTLSPNITRSRCSSTRKMLLLERKFTLSQDTKVEKALSQKPSLIRDLLSLVRTSVKSKKKKSFQS